MLIVITTLSMATSCKKYLELESPSSTDPEVLFESTAYTNSAVIGIYNKLCGDNGYGNRIATLFSLTADDFKTSGSYSASDRRGISMYGASQDNTDLINPFIQLYAGIERANLCIKYIPLSNTYKNGTEAQKVLMKRYYGEALTLRAQFLYELIRNWGDVPAPFTPPLDAATLYAPNANRDETYNHIIADLKIAEDLVPWRNELAEYGSFRFTKAAIKGLRARIALARGGYALRSDTHTMQRRSDYLDFYKIAMDECSDIMNKGDNSLNPIYEDIFKSLHGARKDDAHELMFEVAAFGTNANTDSKLGYYNGIRFNSASTFGSGGGGMNAIPTYFYEFDPIKDCRRDVTIGLFEITGKSKKIINSADKLTDAKFRKSWTSFNNSSTSQNFAINWPLIRFADVLLMYAETDNEINGAPSARAQDALIAVMARAYKGFAIPEVPTDKSGFFNALVKERLLEFGGEGIRKYDLIRWNLIADKFNETRVKLLQFINGAGNYANVPTVVYAKESDYNQVASVTEVASLDLYKGIPSVILFTSAVTAPDKALSYTTKKWRTAITDSPTDGWVTGTLSGFATYFEPNKKELFPYPKSALTENPQIIQNYGY